MLLGSLAQAQSAGTVTLTANRTSSSSAFAPVLTWSTSPVASSCVASGGWSGTKFASGSETLATISSSKSYTLTCTWGSGTAALTWTAPTKNSNGSTLTDLAGYKIVYGTSSGSLTSSQSVNNASATSATVPGLGAATWYFAVRAVNSKGGESANSNVMTKTINAASAARTVNITITSTPPSNPTLKTVSTSVYDVVYSNGTRTLGKLVGNIELGKPCDSTYQIGSRYRVTRSDVTIKVTPRSNSLVAWCKVQ
jgi:hypothetical protein